jgi:predicted nucleotidyltransferase
MVSMNHIVEFGQRLGREFRAERVILFGSRARGSGSEDSDVDLLVILPFEGRSADQAVNMRMKLRPDFPIDLLVRTPEFVRRRVEMGDSFMKDILETGTVLYEAPDC